MLVKVIARFEKSMLAEQGWMRYMSCRYVWIIDFQQNLCPL